MGLHCDSISLRKTLKNSLREKLSVGTIIIEKVLFCFGSCSHSVELDCVMDVILEEMQDVESSCIDEVILPEKEDNNDLQIAFPTKSGLTFLMLTIFLYFSWSLLSSQLCYVSLLFLSSTSRIIYFILLT